MVAPISLSSIAACGPGPMLAISTTVTPVSGPSTTAPLSLLIVGPSLEQTTSTARASPCGGCHQRQETGSAVNHISMRQPRQTIRYQSSLSYNLMAMPPSAPAAPAQTPEKIKIASLKIENA